jgi:hypothetical protein
MYLASNCQCHLIQNAGSDGNDMFPKSSGLTLLWMQKKKGWANYDQAVVWRLRHTTVKLL